MPIVYECVLITGATSGIGQALAFSYLSKAKKVFGLGRNRDKLHELSSSGIQPIECNLSTIGGVERCREWIEQVKPDLVIHCAGYTHYGEICTLALKDLQNELMVHTQATLAILHAMSQLGHRPRTLVNVASALAYTPCPGMSIYSSGKAFMHMLSQLADIELIDSGMRVLCACPGPVATQFQNRASNGAFTDRSWGRQSCEMAALQIIEQIDNLTPEKAIGIKAHLAKWLSYWLPRRLLAKALYRQIKRRYP